MKHRDGLKCGNCGHPPHDSGKDCPAKGRECHNCGKLVGHLVIFRRFVTSIKLGAINRTQASRNSSDAEATVASMAILLLMGEDVNNLLQNGVDSLTAANNSSLECAGRLELQLHYKGRSVTTSILFSPEHDGMLLSCFVCVELGLLPPCYPEPIMINTIVTASPPPIDM